MPISFTLSLTLPVSPQDLYTAWLDSEQHGKMTGGEADCSDQEGASFSAWDGYISGTNIKLTPFAEIVQSWRTTEFAEEDADSELKLSFQEVEGGCECTLTHSKIPEGQPDYEKGWEEHYFTPMRAYFTP